MNKRLFPGLMIVLVAAMGTAWAAPASLGDLTGPWQLLVDDALIARQHDVTRVFHPFEKYSDKPVMAADKPWEGSIVYLYGTVLPEENGPGYRMWYHTWAGGAYRKLYATSTDGVHWEKPALGIETYDGSTANNILVQRTIEDHLPQIVHTPWETDPNLRYKMFTFEYGRTPPNYTVGGYRLAWSSDGIHWMDPLKDPVLPDPGDVGNFVWDPHQRRYLAYPKIFTDVRGYNRRCVGISATENPQQWPATRCILTPDEYDDRWVEKPGQHTDFYGLSGFAYESMYLGFLWVFRITDGKNDGPIFIELVTSRDGEHWQRQPEPRTPLLALGSEGTWDDAMLFTPNHPLVVDDMIRLYYGGFDITHGLDGGAGGIGLAHLRKDGFASLDAGEAEGEVRTKTLLGCAGLLDVNAVVQPGGALRVEVCGADGKAIEGYDREACTPITGNGVRQRVAWKDHPELPVRGDGVQLVFIMRNAALYAFSAGTGVKPAS